MQPQYNPRDFWQQRLSTDFNLKGVGHRSFSEAYNKWLYRRKQDILEAYYRNKSLADKRVFDIGCGTGFFVDWYSRRHAAVDGVDITEVSIQMLKNRFPGEFRVADISIDQLAFDRSYDIVNMWDVMYHIVDQQGFRQALANVAAACRLGGYFLITDRFANTEDSLVAAHVRFRCLSTYQQIMPELGFTLMELRPLFNWLNKVHTRPRLDSAVAPLYYWLDQTRPRIIVDNLCLAVWQRTL